MHLSKTWVKKNSLGFLDNDYQDNWSRFLKLRGKHKNKKKTTHREEQSGPLWVSGMDPLVRPRASMLKVNAAIPLPFPVILVSQILLGEGGCDKVSNGQKKKNCIHNSEWRCKHIASWCHEATKFFFFFFYVTAGIWEKLHWAKLDRYFKISLVITQRYHMASKDLKLSYGFIFQIEDPLRWNVGE